MASASKYTLLVVDDEPDVCDSIQDPFRRDFKVLKARSAAEGYRLMQENEVHIILTDQRMPQVSGVEMLAQIRQGHPGAIRMLFTGYADLDRATRPGTGPGRGTTACCEPAGSHSRDLDRDFGALGCRMVDSELVAVPR